MSTDQSTARDTTEPLPGLEASWRSLEIAGLLIALLGILAIVFPFVSSLSLSLFLGGLLVVGALVHIAHAFRARGWKGFLGEVALAVLYAVTGILLLANPVTGLVTLTLLLIGYFLVAGVVEVIAGLQIRGSPSWLVTVASGLLSILLAALLWVGFPSTAAWALGLLFGINLLSTGLSMVLLGRGVQREVEAEGAVSDGARGTA